MRAPAYWRQPRPSSSHQAGSSYPPACTKARYSALLTSMRLAWKGQLDGARRTRCPSRRWRPVLPRRTRPPATGSRVLTGTAADRGAPRGQTGHWG